MKKQNKATLLFISTLIIVIVLLFMSVKNYMNAQNEAIEDLVQSSINEVVEQQKFNLLSQINSDVDALENLAIVVNKLDDQGNQEGLADILLQTQPNMHYDTLAICGLDGMGITHMGDLLDVSEVAVFQEALLGEVGIGQPVLSMVTGELVIPAGAPVLDSSEEIKGVLLGSYSTEKLNDLLLTSFEGKGATHILDENAQLIAGSILESETSLEEILKQQSRGHLEYTKNGEVYEALFEPLGINGWTVVVTVPRETLLKKTVIINRDVLFILFWASILVSVVLIYWFFKEKNIKKELLGTTYFDQLTGLPNSKKFKLEMEKIKQENRGTQFSCLILDVANFKLINDSFSKEIGDKVICTVGEIANALKDAEPKGTAAICRVHSDTFALFSRVDSEDVSYQKMERFIERCRREIDFICDFKLDFYFGRYISSEHDSVEMVLDKALVAHSHAKISRLNEFVNYDAEFVAQLKIKNDILNNFEEALNRGEFHLYLQPQFRARTRKISGAELLVRWIKDDAIRYYPVEFIPILENAGIISKLDTYLREEVCKKMKIWREKGILFPPISVNVSRVELLQEEFVEKIKKVTDRYEIPPNFFHIEITETAYIDEHNKLAEVVKSLKKWGFRVKMDDFGSGYSSLNVLKDIPVDVVKLDMKFVEHGENAARSGNILSSVIRLAQGINLETVAEGVETKEQVDYLRSIGCDYLQGYYFAKPMPVDDFESMLENQEQVEQGFKRNTVSEKAMNFLDATAQEALLFNTFLGGAAIVELENQYVSILRANDKFLEAFSPQISSERIYNINLFSYIVEEHRENIIADYKQAVITGQEVSGEVCLCVEKDNFMWQSYKIRMLSKKGRGHLFYLGVENVTKRKETEQRLHSEIEKTNLLIDSMPGGYGKFEVENEKIITKYISKNMRDLLEYSEQELNGKHLNALVHPQDRENVQEAQKQLFSGRKDTLLQYRFISKSGKILWFYTSGHYRKITENKGVLHGYFYDITELQKQTARSEALIQNASGGYMQFSYKKGLLRTDVVSDNFCELVGYSKQEILENSFVSFLHPSEVEQVATYMDQSVSAHQKFDKEIRFRCKNGNYLWLRDMSTYVASDENSGIFYDTFYDISEYKAMQYVQNKDEVDKNSEEKEVEHTKKAMQNFPGCVAVAELVDGKLVRRFISDGAYELLGFKEDQNPLESSPIDRSRMSEEDCLRLEKAVEKASEDRQPFSIDLEYFYGTKEQMWINLFVKVVQENNSEIFFYGLYTDIAERKKMEESLRLNKEELQFCLSRLDKQVLRYDVKTDTLTSTKEYAKRHQIPEVLQRATSVIEKAVVETKFCDPEVLSFYQEIKKGTETGVADTYYYTDEGEKNWELSEFVNFYDDQGKPAVALITVSDITGRKLIEQQAQKDGMTGIYNRFTGEHLIKKEMKQCDNYAFIMIDLDNLKLINDTYGHSVGDLTIVRMAEVIKTHFRKTDIVARFGGDEIVVFLPNMREKQLLKAQLKALQEKIRGIKVATGKEAFCSIGALLGDKSLDFASAYHRADEVMYQAKIEGKNTFRIEQVERGSILDYTTME